eukprot:TRINITY_DN105236_c0_g1_i1.p1 TRINITY_DN105236_c0_g1~~TRINITY_DN105236_c0_g1_i1.p1  ORF type:complete len:708 (-),score=231.33 TRINITY_DN105236_c0_g1_i1:49-2172(-)
MANFLYFLTLLVGGATAGDPKQSAAVDIVLKMLADVAAKVEAEGKEEAATFLKFDTFCKETEEETKASITTAADTIGTLSGQIKSLTATNKETTDDIDELKKDITKLTSSIEDKAAERASASAEYASTSQDLGNAVYGVDKAIDEFKAKKSTSFLQKQSFKKTVQAAALLADSLGMKSSSLSGLDAKDTSYDGIVTMLENLQTTFRSKKETADLEEAKAANAFKLAHQAMKSQLKSKQDTLVAKQSDLVQKTRELGIAEGDLAEATTAKKEDEAYLAETKASCAEKRAVNAQHVAGRADELAALSQAKSVLEQAMAPSSSKGTAAGSTKVANLLLVELAAGERTNQQDRLDAANAEASAVEDEEQANHPSLDFLQMQEVRQHQPGLSQERAALVELLSRSAQRLHSRQLAVLATKAGSDPFAAVKEMISGLITKLQKQMAESQSNKAFCDKEIGAAELARDDASTAITQLNTELASTEARRDALVEDLEEINASLATLDKKKEELVKIRAEEAKEAAETIAESKSALEGVQQAKQVITDFYSKASDATVQKQAASSDAKKPSLLQSVAAKPEDEAYKGKQAASKGIIGTLEVIQSDFERTISDTEASNRTAEKEQQHILNDMAVTRAEKLKSTDVKKGFKVEADTAINDAKANMQGEVSKLKSVLLQLTNLEGKCGVGVSYEARKAARAQEMKALKEAIASIDSIAR